MRRLRSSLVGAALCILVGTPAIAQILFVGLEDPSLPTKTSNLNGFPNVIWVSRFPFEVNGAACDGKCNRTSIDPGWGHNSCREAEGLNRADEILTELN